MKEGRKEDEGRKMKEGRKKDGGRKEAKGGEVPVAGGARRLRAVVRKGRKKGR